MNNELERMIQDLVDSGKLDPDMMNQIRAAMYDPAKLEILLEKLKAVGAYEVGSGPPLNIEDFYREGQGKFELKWPLDSSSLSIPFDDLDRKTQFYVLSTEWSRRELEGMMALNNGQLDQAEAIFQECIQRAEQIEVQELVARSYEGLMRVAQKRGEQDLALEWSKKAIEARKI